MAEKLLPSVGWGAFFLVGCATAWCLDLRKRRGAVSERSTAYWQFIRDSKKSIPIWISSFLEGKHQFSPMLKCYFPTDVIIIWNYLDRLVIYLLFVILRKTFKHIIPETCTSIKGPSVIKEVTKDIKDALKTGEYCYFLRIDIKSYYASIDRKILMEQLKENFSHPLTLAYLYSIVNNVVDDGGRVYDPERGIPLRCTLSPFFGSLYLKPLDLAFGSMDVFYRRYVDDIIVLLRSKHQFSKAKKRLYEVLRSLKLELSPQKTKMGKLSRYHFLGVAFTFEVSQNLQIETHVTAEMHPRSCSRALNKVIAMRESAVSAADIQRYLVRWASWWKSVSDWTLLSLYVKWRLFATLHARDVAWLGRGLVAFEVLQYDAPALQQK